MNINYVDYSIGTKSLDIFFAGCNNRCEDCCNPELMSFENGKDYKEWYPTIDKYLKEYSSLIENMILVGGSPTHQNLEEMEDFLKRIKANFPQVSIFLFCGEWITEVPLLFKYYCDYIKCGAYLPNLKCDNNYQYGIKLATSNQKIFKKGLDY